VDEFIAVDKILSLGIGRKSNLIAANPERAGKWKYAQTF
jgi:hypothetical protein